MSDEEHKHSQTQAHLAKDDGGEAKQFSPRTDYQDDSRLSSSCCQTWLTPSCLRRGGGGGPYT